MRNLGETKCFSTPTSSQLVRQNHDYGCLSKASGVANDILMGFQTI